MYVNPVKQLVIKYLKCYHKIRGEKIFFICHPLFDKQTQIKLQVLERWQQMYYHSQTARLPSWRS